MEILIVLLPFMIGGLGYLAVQFWMTPIHRYRDIKRSIASDLVFYANAIRDEGMGERIQQRKVEREDKNRKNAAELKAAYYELPTWYTWLLKKRAEDPLIAANNLIGLSNDPDWDGARHHIGYIKKGVRISDQLNV
ncbi:MAG: hypothetical protein ABIR16_08180 [Dokdonella sp.]